MLNYKNEGTDTAFSNAEMIAGDLLSCGFNTDLALVADVWSNPENTVIGDRAYSDGFQQAAQLVAAVVEGFHAGGVAATLKHFPSHGNHLRRFPLRRGLCGSHAGGAAVRGAASLPGRH